MVVRPSPLRSFESATRLTFWKHSPRLQTNQSRRNAATSNPNSPSARKKSSWLQVTIVTIVAGGIGAYIRYRERDLSPTLNPLTFTKYELISKTPISSTCSIFTLRPVRQGNNYEVYQEAWSKGLWSVQFKQPQLQVGRDYTPLPPIREDELSIDEAIKDGDNLQFLIRREPGGEVSGYLHALQPGAILELRGPQVEYELLEDVHEILFVAGGTGIAPALQAAYTIFYDRQPRDTRVHVLWANRRREDCRGGRSDFAATTPGNRWPRFFTSPAGQTQDQRPSDEPQNFTVSQLEELKVQSGGRFSVDYFVDEEGTLIEKESILRFTNQSGKGLADGHLNRKLILISGPDGFISYLAGPKMWRDGAEAQGPLQGLLKQLDLKDWAVWKL
ncbi:mitochondrial peripheral inner membrane protein [Emydomyces testavorans]|uniref:Mitochondrial peripheral inner membrane protein n=1 Tax=Emydomyces testavorans TaxID=2070801 RepID=A0AAF0ILM9_9EURO|nr:mitochondrial peripheral inner membrane protein [Emydomyces testavorans]